MLWDFFFFLCLGRMPSESLQRYTIILLQTTPQISLLLYFTCSEAYHIVKNYLFGFLHFPSNVWIGICCLLLYIQKTRFLEQWIIISSCLRLWLLTALLIFLLLTTDFPCKRENCDRENSFWCAPGRKYYYKDCNSTPTNEEYQIFETQK